MNKFVGWVGAGICLKNHITNANFNFSYTTTGHGSYMISSNGYSWSHSQADLNSVMKSFHFNTVGDIIYLEYDPKENKIRFAKGPLGVEKF